MKFIIKIEGLDDDIMIARLKEAQNLLLKTTHCGGGGGGGSNFQADNRT